MFTFENIAEPHTLVACCQDRLRLPIPVAELYLVTRRLAFTDRIASGGLDAAIRDVASRASPRSRRPSGPLAGSSGAVRFGGRPGELAVSVRENIIDATAAALAPRR
ncbi:MULTISPECIES: hypothetical protein [Protofrankia]|uniref:hypothetical protein n=1 Tax=Protofrankia TaxID=2994361 RepID=UPI00069C0D2E|nr:MULTISPECIES: hypothetical protein [Protofrankia]ONH36804.1 hypothetical protein BL254_06115 [Protofrankia sp. BMG5.30]